jgi:hypothetical protein
MKWQKLVISALVFVLFVPGVLVTLPPGGSKWTILAVHGVLFALLHWAVQRGIASVL